MIQRIQTLYLIIAFIACVLLYFFPVAKILTADATYYFYLTGIRKMINNQSLFYAYQPILLSLLIILTISIVVAIFLYKNRIRQMRFIAFVFLFAAALLGGIFYFVEKFKPQGVAVLSIDYKQVGFLLPIIIIIMLVLANKAIKKDEAKVRQSYRLR